MGTSELPKLRLSASLSPHPATTRDCYFKIREVMATSQSTIKTIKNQILTVASSPSFPINILTHKPPHFNVVISTIEIMNQIKRRRSSGSDEDAVDLKRGKETLDHVELPIEVWSKILSLMDLKTMFSCRTLNKSFKENVDWIIKHRSLYRVELVRFTQSLRLLEDLQYKINSKLTPGQTSLLEQEALEDGMGDEVFLSQSSIASISSIGPTPPISPRRHSETSAPPSQVPEWKNYIDANKERRLQIQQVLKNLLKTVGLPERDRDARSYLLQASQIPTQAGFTQGNVVAQQEALRSSLVRKIHAHIPQKIYERNFRNIADFFVFFKKFRPLPSRPYSNIKESILGWGTHVSDELNLLFTSAQKTIFPNSTLEVVCGKYPYSILCLVILLVCRDHGDIEGLTMHIYRHTSLEWIDLQDFLSCLKMILMAHLGKNVGPEPSPGDDSDIEEIQETMPDSTLRISTDIGMALDRMQLYQQNQSGEKLTVQQQNVITSNVPKGQIMLVQAFAGTGKTTTLIEFAKSKPRERILYLAFSKDLQVEAEKKFMGFPNVTARTIHSLAWHHMRMLNFPTEKVGGQYNGPKPEDIGTMFKCSLPVAKHIMGTLNAFFSSADSQITTWHVPYAAKKHAEKFKAKKNEPKTNQKWDIEHWTLHEEEYVTFAEQIWTKMRTRGDSMAFSHDAYLKQAYQTDMRIKEYDWILFDEVQDASAVMIEMLKKNQCPMIMVGDRHQRIYGFRRAVRRLVGTLKPNLTTHLSQSFRFGIDIATIANLVLCDVKSETVPMIGCEIDSDVLYSIKDEKLLEVGDSWTFVCRTNKGVVHMALKLMALYPNATFCAITAANEINTVCDLMIDVHSLKQGRGATHWLIRNYQSYKDLLDELEEVNDAKISTAVHLVDELENYQGGVSKAVENLKSRLQSISGEPEVVATFKLTTTHKAKGLEWDNVALGDDFIKLADRYEGLVARRNNAEEIENLDDLNCLYVAMTRAKKKLLLNVQMAAFCTRKLGCTRLVLGCSDQAGQEYYYNHSKHHSERKYCEPTEVNPSDMVVRWTRQLLDL